MHPAALRSAATARGFGGGRSKGKGKQRERYADESDEEATLLLGHVERGADGDPDGDDDGDIGSEGQSSTRLKRLEGSQVSRVRWFILRAGHCDHGHRYSCLGSDSVHQRSAERQVGVEETNPVPSHSDLQVSDLLLALDHRT